MHARALAAAALLLAVAGCVDSTCAGGVTAQPVPGGAIAVAWEPVEGAASYIVLRAADGGEPAPIAEVDASQARFTDANVTAGHTYRYSVATAEGVALDGCSSAQARLADASIPFFGGAPLVLAAAGALAGALWVLRRR